MEIKIPIRLVSEANTKENHYKSNKRHQEQKFLVKTFMNMACDSFDLPCHVTLIRCAPRTFDSDNLQTAFKYIRDAVSEHVTGCTIAGRADNDSRITWEYCQEKNSKELPYIKIKIEPCNITPA